MYPENHLIVWPHSQHKPAELVGHAILPCESSYQKRLAKEGAPGPRRAPGRGRLSFDPGVLRSSKLRPGSGRRPIFAEAVEETSPGQNPQHHSQHRAYCKGAEFLHGVACLCPAGHLLGLAIRAICHCLCLSQYASGESLAFVQLLVGTEGLGLCASRTIKLAN